MLTRGALRRAATALSIALGARALSAQASSVDSGVARPGVERLAAVVQQRLQLTDEQTAHLRETAQRYAEQRKALLRDERDARRTVRDEVARGDAADQARVQGALDRLYAIQQRRSELAASEQRDLATFLTPTQRAQYAGMQERAFRTAQQIRQRRDAIALRGGVAGDGSAPPVDPRAVGGSAVQAAARRAEREQRQAARRAERQALHRPR